MTNQAIIYQPIKADELKELKKQPVIDGKNVYSPKDINEKIVAFKSEGKQK